MPTRKKKSVQLDAPVPDYLGFFAGIKQRILLARITAARTVNRELILLYWDIGRSIVEKQKEKGWGDSVVERLSADLRVEFPRITGFSPQNLWRMKQFFITYTSADFLSQAVREFAGVANEPEILSQAVRELAATVPWGHHAHLLGKASDPASVFYYLRATAQLGWSRSVLLNQIKAQTYERAVAEKKTHNFELALPSHLAEQADEMLKSRYNLEFLGIAQAMHERELEDRLVSHLQRFILELGYGFCFIGRQYRLILGKKDYYVDLLFYHRFLKVLVAFDLKITGFEPEHAGKMDFYLNLLNEKELGPDDQPSIGIILCAEKDDIEVEFSLKTKNNPIGVAEYQLQPQLPSEFEGRLPTAQQLADAVRTILPKETK